MIRITIEMTVEMVPHGVKSKKHVIARAALINDGTGTDKTGNYDVMLSQGGRPKTPWRQGRVEGFPRERKSVWYLIHRALSSVLQPKAAAPATGQARTSDE